jgi:NADPH:quinone reductase-like Zn-dependent oxidoreductase
MRAVEFDRYGGGEVLRVREVPDPTLRDGQVLVRVRAASVNPKDLLARAGKFRLFSGLTFPKRTGYDWSGEALQVGAGVRGVQVGDALYGMLQPWTRGGACAELLAVDPGQCARRPAGLSFEEAAALPLAGLTALQALRDLGAVGPGSRVLIHGASGGVGAFAVQIARALGAARVVAVCGPDNQQLCADLGAHRVLDHRKEDPVRCGEVFDVFFDVFGNRSLGETRAALAERGVYVSTIPRPRVLADVASSAFSSRRARLIVVRSRRADLEALGALVTAGQVRVILDSIFPLEAIAEAQGRVATKHARGKVVVRVGGG